MPTINCNSCGGTGLRTCARCNGQRYEPRYNFKGEQELRLCGHCGGRGGTPCYQCGGTGKLSIETGVEPNLDIPNLDIFEDIKPYNAKNTIAEIEKIMRKEHPERYKSWRASPGTQKEVIQALQIGYFKKHVLDNGANDKTYRLKLKQVECFMKPSAPYHDLEGIRRDYIYAVREGDDVEFRFSRGSGVRNKQGRFEERN